MSKYDYQENIEDEAATVAMATTTVRIFFSLREMGLVQYDELLMSTSLVWLMFLPVWEK